MRLRVLLLGQLVLLLSALPNFAQDLTLSARLHNEEIYFPDSEIELYITVKNETPRSQRFRLADDRAYNLSFDLRDDQAQPVPSARNVTTETAANQVYYRTISLEPGDHFSFIERLTDYVDIDEPGIYSLSIMFYPELFSVPNQVPLKSNTITISIRPGETPERRTLERYQAVVVEELRRQQLSPDETVRYMLDARRQANWDRFFLYLNLEKLLRQSPSRDRQFRQELSEAAQRDMLDTYRDELIRQANPQDSALTVIPDSYEIVRTTYTPTDGTVVADLRFDFDTYRERKRYTYFLERRNGFWEIIGYEVSNLPNEAITR